MKKIIYLTILTLSFSFVAMAQKKNVIEKSEDQIKMFNAQQSFFAGDYNKALNLYRDVLSGKPNDANVMGRIAECHFMLLQYKDAQDMGEKAKSIDEKAYENTSLVLGKIYHLQTKLDEALVEYNYYKSLVGNGAKAKDSDIDVYIAQIAVAKELMAKAANVKVENMGDKINSEFDDKAPMVTADGKFLIFTSQRPGISSKINTEGDGKYYEDIYMSRWDTLKKMWSEAELIPGSVNSEAQDACTSISPDGKTIYLFKNDMDGESRGGDIYISKISSSGKWGVPKTMGKPVNTTYAELGACISPDGKTLYFVSERKGGMGNADIWMLKKKTKSEWEAKPVNIGSEVNSEFDEGGLFIAPDGKTLFFSSNGPGSMGGYDIFKTTFENGKWSKPVNLGYPINTTANDKCFSLSVDAQTGYITSDRVGGFGERDIYKIDLSNYAVLEKDMAAKKDGGPVMAILKGDVFDATAGAGMEAEINIFDEAGNKVASTTSSQGSGEYFITLMAEKSYVVKIEVKGYKAIEEKVDIKAAKEGATTVVKHYLLYKK